MPVNVGFRSLQHPANHYDDSFTQEHGDLELSFAPPNIGASGYNLDSHLLGYFGGVEFRLK